MSKAGFDADSWVRNGFALQRAGDADGARAAFLQALVCNPEHAAALQLLAQLARQRGDLEVAETLMRRSLQVQPDQPHVWNNLGNLLLAGGRLPESLACFDQALGLHSNYADAHYNRARALHAALQPALALPAVEQAQRCMLAQHGQPSASLMQLKSQIQADLGDLSSALLTVDRALVLAPERPALLHNRATLLQRLYRFPEALQMHQRAQELGLDVADAHYNLGNTYQSLGRPEEALDAYRRALQRAPGHALALHDLARLRWRMGQSNFDEELRQSIDDQPASAQAAALLAHLLWRAERYADAAEAFAIACQRAPQQAQHHDGWARCMARLARFEDSLIAHARALDLSPGNPDLLCNHAASLLMAHQPELALRQTQAALVINPHDSYAWALQGLAWRLLGDPQAFWLDDIDRLVKVIDLPAPTGFASMADFNHALQAELVAQHLDRAEPVDQTLRGGTQTVGKVFEHRHPLVDTLKAEVTRAMVAYLGGLPDDPAHPFLQRNSGHWRFTDSWSSRLRSGGFHTNHVHPHGWISSVYYVSVPNSVRDSKGGEGWLQFGQSDMDLGSANAVRLRVQPLPGRLVLFPSMFWHGTAPFFDAEHRLTVAFDAVPV